MVDRFFAGFMLLVTIAYGAIAFTVIRAPFQYDPLGPETWPRVLAVAAMICLAVLLWRPDVSSFGTNRSTWIKLSVITLMLFSYAELYQPLGFVISTTLFSTLLARLLGAGWWRAGLFGIATGAGGYLLCAGLLDLNLPSGPLPRI